MPPADGTNDRPGQIIVSMHAGQVVMDLNRPVTTIGRSRSSTLRLDDRSISGLHCEIVQLPAGYLLIDHGSKNGTTLRDGKTVSEVFLRNGDVFRVGHASVRFVGPNPDDAAVAARAQSAVVPGAAAPGDVAPGGVAPDGAAAVASPLPAGAIPIAPGAGAPFVPGTPGAPATGPTVLVLGATPGGPLIAQLQSALPAAPARAKSSDSRLMRVRRRRRWVGEGGVPLGVFLICLAGVIGATAVTCWHLWKSGAMTGTGAVGRPGTADGVADAAAPGGAGSAAASRAADGSRPGAPEPVAVPSRQPQPAGARPSNAPSQTKAPPVPAPESAARPEADLREEGDAPAGAESALAGGGAAVERVPEDAPVPGGSGATGTAEEAPDRRWDYEFLGVPSWGTHVCFVLDASASMSLPAENATKTKREVMKKQLVEAIDDLDPAVSFAVVFFTTEAHPLASKFVAATAANKASARTWVEQFERRGATNLWSGLQKGFDLVRKVPAAERSKDFHVTLYVLSDGRVRDAKPILRAAEALLQEAPVTIHTISFDEKDEVLRDLARIGKGEYQTAD